MMIMSARQADACRAIAEATSRRRAAMTAVVAGRP